jgi:adhesin/invasin
LIQTDNWRGERLAFIRPGADGVTISNYTIKRLYSGEDASGAIVVRKSREDNEDVVRDITFRNVTIDNAPAQVAKPDCSSSAGTSCATAGIVVSAVHVEGMVVEGSDFRNFAVSILHPRRAIDMGGALSSKNIDIRDNTFVNIQTGDSSRDHATILFPEGVSLTGDNYVRGNTFDNSAVAAAGQVAAIGWTGAVDTKNSTQASNLYIQDNHFDGYARATVALRKTGAVTVQRNTFGAATGSAAVTQNEETWGWGNSYKVMMLNEANTANRRILTWYPVDTRVTQGCEFQVDLSRPTAAADYGLPNEPVTIDFYYTAGRTAEVYLGSVSGVTADQSGRRTVTVPEFPPSVSGFVRVQTQGAPASQTGSQVESSQYSRALSLPDFRDCLDPELDLRIQAWRDADPGAAADHGSIHDAVIDTGTLIPSGGRLNSGLGVWITYTVANTGYVPLAHIQVHGSFGEEVCVIEFIPPGGSAGCAEHHILA